MTTQQEAAFLSSKDPVASHAKLVVALRHYLLGKGFYKALEAMEFCRPFYDGMRKDGATPKFDHPVRIVLRLRTLEPSLPDPESCYILGFTHDVSEDKGVGFEEIDARFGAEVGRGQRLITKKFRGVVVPDEIYYPQMADCPMTALVKGSDNTHNIFTMVGAFDLPKQVSYMAKSEAYVDPMLKAASRRFPRFEAAFTNIRVSLETQIALIREAHRAAAG